MKIVTLKANPYHKEGSVLDLETSQAKHLIAKGYAVAEGEVSIEEAKPKEEIAEPVISPSPVINSQETDTNQQNQTLETKPKNKNKNK